MICFQIDTVFCFIAFQWNSQQDSDNPHQTDLNHFHDKPPSRSQTFGPTVSHAENSLLFPFFALCNGYNVKMQDTEALRDKLRWSVNCIFC